MLFAQAGASAFSFAISADTTNVNLRTAAITAGWNQTSALTCTINSGVVVYSTSTGTYAMTVSGSFPNGVSLVNNGTILGKGGAGGQSANYVTPPGNPGGPALNVTSAVSITNASGRIAGGGGGGGCGSNYAECIVTTKTGCIQYQFYTSGAGGGGIGNGAGGAGEGYGGSGTAGTLTTAGTGGNGFSTILGAGGNGGSYGSAGSSGVNAPSSNYLAASAGGAAGAAVVGNSNITWVSFGTRNGSIS